MKILVIGSGGREHALVWKLAQSPHVTQLWCAPGNTGIAQERLAKNSAPVECVNLGAGDLPKLLAFAQEKKVELTVVGPDNPLALGIVDLFQNNRQLHLGAEPKGRAIRVVEGFLAKFHGEARHPHRARRDF